MNLGLRFFIVNIIAIIYTFRQDFSHIYSIIYNVIVIIISILSFAIRIHSTIFVTINIFSFIIPHRW